MKRKKEIYEELKKAERDLRELANIVQSDENIPSEDEIHGWVISMNGYISNLEKIKLEVIDFYSN